MRITILLSLFIGLSVMLPCPSNDAARVSAMSDAPVVTTPDEPFDCVLRLATSVSERASLLCELVQMHALAGHQEHAGSCWPSESPALLKLPSSAMV